MYIEYLMIIQNYINYLVTIGAEHKSCLEFLSCAEVLKNYKIITSKVKTRKYNIDWILTPVYKNIKAILSNE